jgi:hypothetical protein
VSPRAGLYAAANIKESVPHLPGREENVKSRVATINCDRDQIYMHTVIKVGNICPSTREMFVRTISGV